MFTKTQMTTMLKLQDEINSKVNPNWKNANNDWLLAAMMESVEAIDHHGWKWWKYQEQNIEQLQMELVDIWHFILSKIIVDGNNYQQKPFSFFIFNNTSYNPNDNSLVKNLKLLTALFAVDEYNLHLFETILKQSHLSYEELYKQYIGKNVLNIFRQDNGYKEGSYVKIWYDRKEDNEHLSEILKNLKIENQDIKNVIYTALNKRYLKNEKV